MFMDDKLADAFKHFLSHMELDISGNIFTNQSGCKAECRPSNITEDCGIKIDTEITEAVSQLPEKANLDLSGNTVTKMDPSLPCHVIPVISKRKIDLSGLGVVIDAEVSKAICSLDEDVNVHVSDNVIAKMDYQLLCELLYRLYRKTIVDSLGTIIKYNLLQVIYTKPTETCFDISSNDRVIQDIILSMMLTADKWKTQFQQDNNEFMTNEGMAVLSQHLQGHIRLEIHDIYMPQMRISILPIVTACMSDQGTVDLSDINESTELDMSGHHITSKSTYAKLIQKTGTLAALRMLDCGLIIDTEIAEAISQLPEQANLDLFGNTVTKMDSSLLCHVIPVVTNRKIDLSGLGVVIGDKVAQTLFSLKNEVEVDLSGNKASHQSACITLIHKAATMKCFSICNSGIQIDTEITEAVSRLPDHTQICLVIRLQTNLPVLH